MTKHEPNDVLLKLVQEAHPHYPRPYFLTTNNGSLVVAYDFDAIPDSDSVYFMPQIIAGKSVMVSRINFQQKLDKISKDEKYRRRKEADLAAETNRQAALHNNTQPSVWD